MSDSKDSTVIYTQISSPFTDLSEIGSPGVDGPPIMPDDPYAYVVDAFQAPPLPDYVPGPEEPKTPLPLDFVPEPVYSEFMPPDDEVLPAEEHLLPAAASPTDQSPGYIPESDPKEDPEEDDEDPEEDPADYPADRDDDDDEKEEKPSGDDADDEDEDEDENEEEEEEHPAPADSVPPIHRMTARISIWDEPSISLPPMEEVERLLALTTPPSSPLTPLPSLLPQIPSPPLLPIPAPISSPPVLLPSTDHRADRPEVCLPPRKRLCSTQGPRYEVEESSSAAAARPTRGHRADYGFVGIMDTEIRQQRAEEVGYGIIDVWVDLREAVEEVAPMTLEGDRQTQIYQRVETLVDDSQYHYETARLLDQEALVSWEAWGRSIEVSYMAHSEIMALCSIVMSQQAVISQLQAADRAACADFDIDAVTTGIGDHSTGTGDNTTGTTGTLWRKMAPKRKTRSTPETTTTTTFVTNAQLQAMIDQGVTAALAARDATRNSDDNHTSRTGVRRTERVARECTYQDLMKCQPLYFKGTEGVVKLTQLFERMETVFRISNCSVDNQIKFSTCTLLAGALTWWNSYVRIVGQDVANEMKKLEVELWNLKVKGTDVTGYNQRFQELVLLYVRMFPKESDKIERYVGGLPDMIHASVVASKPKTMQEATKMASELMDKKINTITERQAENKRKFEDTSRNNQNHPQHKKR
ncbi:hypothetical protein Tco_0252946 [Tanacetum coccineum]